MLEQIIRLYIYLRTEIKIIKRNFKWKFKKNYINLIDNIYLDKEIKGDKLIELEIYLILKEDKKGLFEKQIYKEILANNLNLKLNNEKYNLNRHRLKDIKIEYNKIMTLINKIQKNINENKTSQSET